MLLLIVFAFLAGIVTILSPCILPILPIVLSGSLVSGKRRPFGITLGFIASFSFFTLTLSAIVRATGLPADSLRSLAVIIIFIFGLSLIFPQTQAFIEKLFSRFANLFPQVGSGDGFGSGILVGLSLGLVWAPCVGPILASVITLAVSSNINLAVVLITLAYATGTAIPMLAITYGGRQLLQKGPWLLTNTQKIQRGFGVVMMMTAIAIFFNADRAFQTFILTQFPQYGTGLTKFEENDAIKTQLEKLRGGQPTAVTSSGKLLMPTQRAADFTEGGEWLNSSPLSLAKDLKGKVVLVDFWTYSCINCIRTFPYLRRWYDTYKDKGFVIVGVHTPEFAFEKEKTNVQKAVTDYMLTYPVVQDNDFLIWNAYDNQYWPAHYLIDKDGFIRYTHFGEGQYVETENAIRQLLEEAPLTMAEPPIPLSRFQTPETYLGWSRATAYAHNIRAGAEGQYAGNQTPQQDQVVLGGRWYSDSDFLTAKATGATLKLKFAASDVYLVADGGGETKYVSVLLDGQPLSVTQRTKNYDDQGRLVITTADKYDIVTLPKVEEHTLTLTFPAGTMPYVFTFGAK